MKSLLLLPVLWAAPAPPAGPDLGHRSDSPTVEAEDVSAALEALRAELGIPGMVVLALQDGEQAAFGAAGVRVHGSDERITIDDPMHLGSCTKAMTATLAAKLIEEGLLDWDTTIAEVLPDLAEQIDPGFHGVTVEDLLQHRGGIAERRRPEIGMLYAGLGTLEGTITEVRLQHLARVMKTPPLMPEAEGGNDYSNFGYMTVGAMLERLTEKTWGDLMVEKLFRPLGMESAGIGSPTGENVPVGHLSKDGVWAPLPATKEGYLHFAMGPAGLAHANLPDWGKFVTAHIAGARGEDDFLKAETYVRLHTPPENGSYAAGWVIGRHRWSWGEGDVLWHNGSDNTWYSLVFVMPEWDLVIMVAANAAGTVADQGAARARDLMLATLGFAD